MSHFEALEMLCLAADRAISYADGPLFKTPEERAAVAEAVAQVRNTFRLPIRPLL